MGELICSKCGVPLEEREVSFMYLETRLTEKAPCCPVCGQVYLPESVVTEKIAPIEKTLEEK